MSTEKDYLIIDKMIIPDEFEFTIPESLDEKEIHKVVKIDDIYMYKLSNGRYNGNTWTPDKVENLLEEKLWIIKRTDPWPFYVKRMMHGSA